MLYRYWLRSNRALFYGAEQYVISAVNVINSNSTRIVATKEYLSANSWYILSPILIYLKLFALAVSKRLTSKEVFQIFQFPFIPPFCSRSSLSSVIICFHHVDLLNGSLRSRLTELAGLVFLLFYPKNIRIVCVSNFWLDWLKSKGFTSVKLILNPITPEFVKLVRRQASFISCSEASFQDPIAINTTYSHPIIYLGIARKSKGWIKLAPLVRSLFPASRIYASSPIPLSSLHPSDLIFANFHNVSIKYFSEVESFYSFLTTVDISIFASEFKEGWNRTLLEASLLGNGLTFALTQAGMQDVCLLAPWIIKYKSDLALHTKLKSLTTSQELSKEINKSKDVKLASIDTVITQLSIDKFLHDWEVFSYG